VYLKVSPMRGIHRFNVRGKLAPRYIGPFKVLERKGEVPYRLELPLSLSGVHDVFHMSQLKKCLRVPEEQALLEGLDVQEDLTYTEHPVKNLETSKRVTGTRKSRCAVFSGVTTRRTRLPGSEKMSYGRRILNFLLASLSESRDEIPVRAVGL
jgi:hypothetical protein